MIDLRVEAPGAGPTVLGDPVLLEWALEALVKNAIDALQGRPGAIILRVGAEDGMGAIRVIDDGPGVPRSSGAPCSSRASPPSGAAGASGSRSSRRVVEDAHGGASDAGADREGNLFRDSHSAGGPET